MFSDCRARNKGSRILLIADQFEEAFTLVVDDSVRDRFVDVLLAGFPDPAAGASPDICLILTLRADFYGRAVLNEPLTAVLQNHEEILSPMTRDELQSAIVCPAERAGVSFEAGLVPTLLDAVAGKPGSLPLLQFALREMWEQQENRTITRASYDTIGGVEGALAQRAGAIYDTLTKNGTDKNTATVFRRLFMRLVTFGEGAEDTRRIVGREELSQEEWALAQRLANEDNRLVVTNARVPGHETAEVVHEALIRNWPILIQWVGLDREFQSWRQQLRPRAEEWRKSPADEGTLLRGGPLIVADDWLTRRPDEFSEEERTFIAASTRCRETEQVREKEAQAREQARLADIAAAQRRTTRLQRYLIAVLALVVVGLVGWFKQSYLEERWYWFKVVWPYMRDHVRPLSADAERALVPKEIFRECDHDTHCPDMVVLPAGEFMMGSSGKEPGPWESPQHKVTVAKFAVSKFPVTFDDWKSCNDVGGCKYSLDDNAFGRGTKPVINVRWEDAHQYVQWLSRMTGWTYRLLTEAEWEYTARADTKWAYYWGDEIGKGKANCDGCGSKWDKSETSPVGSFPPNAFGLYDMLGNVSQWVQDCDGGTYDRTPKDGSAFKEGDCNGYFMRGGSWGSEPKDLRSAARFMSRGPGYADSTVGFRVGRTLIP